MAANTIIGHNSSLKPVLERAKLVARSDVPVLLLGETGSGKEVLAKYIHEESNRSGEPFLKVNCGAVPQELIDSYLFGHEKGAFTGAVDRRKGWFESANGGTLLLDEIGELPLAAQVRFLRVLQDGNFEPVGSGGKTVKVDVRVIAATHRNLQQMVKEGMFREDLWYRISVFPIRIPPLRERRGDIEALTRYFVRKATAKFHLPDVLITKENLAVLAAEPWLGNVREFAAVIDRAVLLGEGLRLALTESLDSVAHGERQAYQAVEVPIEMLSDVDSATDFQLPSEKNAETASLEMKFPTLDEAVRRHIEAALSRTHGVIEGSNGAAALLDINPHTLRAKMRKLGVDWSKFRRNG
ncbi:MAG: sigma-54 dependent transcriptional regulator [Planctomycetaceae bacterium]|nr:sigma-54 dependent transcriptional regulator [Planctomycetaceae bacterium]